MVSVPASFAAPWDRQLRIATPLVCALILALVVIVPSPNAAFGRQRRILILLFDIFAWALRAYRIEGNELVGRRWIGRREFYSRTPVGHA